MDIFLLPERYQKMSTSRGFRDLVNDDYEEARKVNPKVLKEDIFWKVNDEWYSVARWYRYTDFRSFTAHERGDRYRVKKKNNRDSQ